MNGIPMKLDYSKTLNEQLDTFEYYKNRYCSYELELIEDRKEIERLNNIINELEKYLKEQNDEHYSWHYREWIKQILNKLKGDNK